MLPPKYIHKYSLLAVSGSLISLLLILFMQPMNPARFLASVIYSPSVAGSARPGAILLFAFWASACLLLSGIAGFFFAFSRHRPKNAQRQNQLNRYGDDDAGEENWMFI